MCAEWSFAWKSTFYDPLIFHFSSAEPNPEMIYFDLFSSFCAEFTFADFMAEIYCRPSTEFVTSKTVLAEHAVSFPKNINNNEWMHFLQLCMSTEKTQWTTSNARPAAASKNGVISWFCPRFHWWCRLQSAPPTNPQFSYTDPSVACCRLKAVQFHNSERVSDSKATNILNRKMLACLRPNSQTIQTDLTYL